MIAIRSQTALALAVFCSSAAPVCAEVTGRVTLKGSPKNADRVIKMAGDPKCAHFGEIKTEVWKVSEDGGLAEAVVIVPDAPPNESPREVLMDQTGCRYVPHVVAIEKGASVRFRNSDPTLHNVRGTEYRGKGVLERNLFNVGQPGKGTQNVIPFKEPGRYQVKCDVHPWMQAWVIVAESGTFAVSTSDGSFKLPTLPDGDYTARAWHGGFDEPVETRFTVTGGTARLEIEFDAAQAN